MTHHSKISRTAAAFLFLGLAGLQPAVSTAQTLPDPSVCASGDAWIGVVKDAIVAMANAHTAGRLTDAQFTELSVWSTQMENYLLQTGNTKTMCEQYLVVRKTWGL